MKIVFVLYNLSHIDNWIRPLYPFLGDAEIHVFHLAKLQKKGVPELKGVVFHDLSELQYNEIEGILQEITPNACVFLNFRSMFELLLQRISKNLNIPDIYLEHGIFNTNNLKFAGARKKEEIYSSTKRQACFIRKYLSFIKRAKEPLSELQVWGEVFLKKKIGNTPFTHYFVYGQRCKGEISAFYSLDNNNTTLVGYPLFRSAEDEKNVIIPKSKQGVLYVHQPFIQDKYTSINYDEEKDYIESLANKLIKRYNSFTVLLHPRENLEKYQERFKNTNISIVQRPGDYTVFSDKELVLGHYSTALLFPLFFKTPTVIVDYPNAYIQPIFQGIFNRIHNLSELDKLDVFDIDEAQKDFIMGPSHNYENIAIELRNYIRSI